MRVDVVDEFAVAGEAVEIVADVGLFDPAGDLLDGSVVVDEVAGETTGILFPEFVVAVEDIIGNGSERLAIDFHDDAVGREVRIHPIEGQAFLDEKFVVGIFVEDDFCDESVDVHDSDLAGDLNAIIDDMDFFAGFELIESGAAIDIESVFLDSALLILDGGRVDLAVGIEAAGTFRDVIGVGGFEKEAIEADAGVALGILTEEIGETIGKGNVSEAVESKKTRGRGRGV